MSFLVRSFVVVALLAPVAACIPEGGNLPPGSNMVSCGGASGTSALATWANVRDIIEPQLGGCYGSDCHREGEREPILLEASGTPRLSDAALYQKLTTYRTVKCGGRVLVKPCAPDDSSFYLAQTGACGDLLQMPFGCVPAYDNCTPADKLEGLRQWIANGAPAP